MPVDLRCLVNVTPATPEFRRGLKHDLYVTWFFIDRVSEPPAVSRWCSAVNL